MEGVALGVMEGVGLRMSVWFRFVSVSSTLLTLNPLTSPSDLTSVGVAKPM